MSEIKNTVITAYGHDKVIDKIVVTNFTETNNWSRNQNAKLYCDTINSLDLKEGTWALARVVSENVPYAPSYFIPYDFTSIIIDINDLALQWIIRESELRDLAKALKGEPQNVVDKVLANMSKNKQQEFKNEIFRLEQIMPFTKSDVLDAQYKIIEFINRSRGEDKFNVFPRSSNDESGKVK